MDSFIDYDTVKTLVANPPSLDPHPNLFNLHALQTHFARALKHFAGPQLTVNGWLGAVMSKDMYALVDGTPFKAGNKPKTEVPGFPKICEADGIIPIPNTHEQTSASPGNLIASKTTTKHPSTSVARSTTRLIATLAMPIRSRPQHLHPQSGGTAR
jgi:hypothetical protein